MPELKDEARGRWRAILPLMGIDAKHLENRQGPCPICGGKDRFRFDDKEGDGTWYCNACGAGDGARLLMLKHGGSFKEMAAEVRQLLPSAPFVKPKAARSADRCYRDQVALWRSSQSIRNDMAEEYLRFRGFEPPYPPDLRFVPSALASQSDEGFLPALIAKVSGPDGKGVNIHRTFLRDGRKVYRAMMPGELPPGCSIRLSPLAEHLGTAEGIETALSVTKRFGVACWSLISTGGMLKFTPPPVVKRLSIYGDNDLKFGGQAAAYGLAHRLTTAKDPIDVEVVLPEVSGTDFAD